MAITDYSTTPSDNTSIGGISIAENSTPPGNINDAIRRLMADIATALDDGTFLGGADFQPLDALLTAIAALTVAADKGLYFTGSDAPATFDLTSAARTLLGKANTADMLSYIGGQAAPAVSGSSSSGKIALGGGFVFTWRDATSAANTAIPVTYGGGHTYSSWARAWCTGGAQEGNAQDNNPFVYSAGLSSASVYSSRDGSDPITLFSIGV